MLQLLIMDELLTRLIKENPLSSYVEKNVLERGYKYFAEGRVWDITMQDKNTVCCDVEGDSGDYKVTIRIDRKKERLAMGCNCPYARNNFCKHMVAAIMQISEDIEFNVESADLSDVPAGFPSHFSSVQPVVYPWQHQMDAMLEKRANTTQNSARQFFAAAMIMYTEKYYGEKRVRLTPLIVKEKDWQPLQDMPDVTPAVVNRLLIENTDWLYHSSEMPYQANPSGCLNLKPEAIQYLMHLMRNAFYLTEPGFMISQFLTMNQMDIPLFLYDPKSRTIQHPVQTLQEPQNIRFFFNREQDQYTLKIGLEGEGGRDAKPVVLCSTPPWVLLEDKIFMLDNAKHIEQLESFPILIPVQHEEAFRQKYADLMVQTFDFEGDVIQWHDVQVDAVARLYLFDGVDNKLQAGVRFAYGEQELLPTKDKQPSVYVQSIPGTWEYNRIHRQPEQEQKYLDMLSDSKFGLKRAGKDDPYGTFELRSRTHPFDFLMDTVPQLIQAGFEIYGEKDLKIGRVNHHTPSLHVNITSGIDWFDLNAFVEYGEQQISLQEIRKAVRRGKKYIKLADGSVGQIPGEWLEKYRYLWNLADETENGYRLNDFHLPLLDSLLDSEATIEIPADLAQRKEKLQTFEHIKPMPLPQGFQGELRPYQKHGFDWLHFLNEYRFGGILADDMGLGKTIQILAYLQSLYEKSNGKKTSLLLVPKSIIANWQREAEKFTPSLRFMEYLGSSRSLDTTEFEQVDVVLTTYGTMLRDIEHLRSFKFDHIILDESQAIKNPLSKSSRAVRLLQAEHRFAMTGTPIENNTYELWSQFAFLNPGLLGSLDYFRHEFAKPIETDGDHERAQALRKLVFPFILRRTKKQVAPELPPRTERIIYTAMNSSQEKIYQKTRQRYCAELLGLIEEKGMNDTRFKILEGLLRLRQIAIHPALMDDNFKGDSPKFEVLLERIVTLQAENHKALIFSQFVETLRLLRRELDALHISYAYLDGSTSNRQQQVDFFQNEAACPLFLISLKAGGVGLNLTAADYVFHLDPWWNPAVEMQASDRAYRIGQERPVFVYKIITRDTVEEKILQLQERKRALVSNLISTESGFFKTLTQEDVKALFE